VYAPASSTIAPGATLAFTTSPLDQFGNAFTSGSPANWTASRGSITRQGVFTAPADAGSVTITASNGAITGSTTILVHLLATAPAFVRSTLPHRLTVDFNGDVGASLAASDFVVTNLTTASVMNSTDFTVAFNSTTRRATLSYTPGALPDGRYQLTLAAANVQLSTGQLMQSPVSFDFAFYQGDITGDGQVDFSDLLVLAQNYNQSVLSIEQGDLNYDGQVDFGDLLILAQRYNTGLPSVLQSRTTTSKRRATSRAH
jgi:hypothetical protein